MTTPSRDEVLRVAGECGFWINKYGCISTSEDGELCGEEIYRFAAAMYAAGEERIRFRLEAENKLLEHNQKINLENARAYGEVQRQKLTAERELSDKLAKALLVAKAFCDGLTAEECPDTVAIPIGAALAEVAAIRKGEQT